MKKKMLALVLALALLLSGCGVVMDGKGKSCDSHSDTDENGVCDRCSQSVMTTFDFYTINDLHGKIVDGDGQPGVDELTSYLRKARYTDDNVVILSAGDMWQGSSESNLTYGNLTTEWMNDIGFTAMTLGNHEFDWGEDYIEANEKLAEFPFLAINIYDRQTNTQVDYCQSSTVVDADGIQIGIIGAMGDCYSSIASDKVKDVYFKTGSELTSLVKAESQRLRSQGVDFVVYVIHDGNGRSSGTSPNVVAPGQMKSYFDVELSQGYVDLVFEGHTHQQYISMDQNGVYHLQNRGDNKGGLSHVEVAFNTVTGSFHVAQPELISSDRYTAMVDDPIVEELLEKYKEQVAIGNQILGKNSRYRNSNYLREVVADLYYQVGVQEWGDEYDIVLGGGFLSARSPYDLDPGDVTYSDLQSIFPFDNDLVLCSISGSDLLNRFIHTDNDNYFISGNQELINGIRNNGIYYIVVDTYTSSYAANRLTVVEEYEKGVYARDLLADHISHGGFA